MLFMEGAMVVVVVVVDILAVFCALGRKAKLESYNEEIFDTGEEDEEKKTTEKNSKKDV